MEKVRFLLQDRPTKNSRKLKTVNIGSSIVVGNMKYNITSIEKNAFKGCKYLSGVNIGPGVKVIGASAFEKCVRLNKVTIKTMYLKFVGKKHFRQFTKKQYLNCLERNIAYM